MVILLVVSQGIQPMNLMIRNSVYKSRLIKKFSWTYTEKNQETKTNHHFPGIIVEQKTDTSFEGDFKTYQELYMRVDRWGIYTARELTWNIWNFKEGQ